MRRILPWAMIFLSISIAAAADKEKRFSPGAASSYPNAQTQAGVVVAAVPFTSPEDAKAAFGKVNPYEHGVLPVLIVIENKSNKAFRLNLAAEYIRPDRKTLQATPATEVPYLKAPDRPRSAPLPFPTPKKKSPLLADEITLRAFAAKMLPPNDSVSGFVYFQTTLHDGAIVVVQGLTEAASGKELFFFEVPLAKP